MRKLLPLVASLAGLALSACVPAPTPRAAAAPAAQSSALAQLVEAVNIPYETFTLDNGLRVVVHEDRKAPVVAVSVWYNVGSKDEPAGRSGFAHLFEHMMFYGSENAPGDFFARLQQIGATDWNGTTWFDRTNYFETVPTAALDTALFYESDRMGHLLGAVTEEKFRNQVGVVQNEKRESDNQPYGLVQYRQLETLFPEGHPYRHSPIGSMADLSAASLQDVHRWFRERYGPNNAVLVLAGDIDAATARPLVERYFGDIARGPENRPAQADVPTLGAPVSEVMRDRVATTRLYRSWAVPGLTHADTIPLQIAASALGGLASSRLDNILVREEQSAVRVSADLEPMQRVGIFEVEVDVRPGGDADQVSARLDRIIADFIAGGPSRDEVERVTMQMTAERIRGLEQVGGFGGKAVTLAEGLLYANDPALYRRQLQAIAGATPEQVRGAMQRWLTRPVYSLRVVPGEREAQPSAEAMRPERAALAGGGGTHRPYYFRAPEAGEQPLAPAPAARSRVDRSRIPPVGTVRDLEFPVVERATLSNGIRVAFARRTTVPVVRVSIQFDAGFAADPRERLGLHSLMAQLLQEGTATRSSRQIAEEQERLGALLSTGAGLDRTTVSLAALRPNLGPSLDLMADIVRNPAFDPREIERLRAQRLARIAAELTQPQSIALRMLPPLLYGPQHPYGVPFTGSGTAQTVQAIARADLAAAHASWLRPDNAELFVVGDTTLAEIVPLLEARFGRWQAAAGPRGTKNFAASIPAPRPRIVLVDRPQSPQSMILAGQILSARGTDDLLTLITANEVLGGSPSARIPLELRERRGWSYGAYGYVNRVEHQVPYLVLAPVQTDRTGDSIRAAQAEIQTFLTSRGVTREELSRTIEGNILELPGSYETGAAVLAAMQSNALFDRPDDYQARLPSRYRAMTAADLDRAARAAIDPARLIWVVVGDARVVQPQLERLGLPIETMALR